MLILESKNINLKKTLCPSHDGDEIKAVPCAPLRRVDWSAIFESGAGAEHKQNCSGAQSGAKLYEDDSERSRSSMLRSAPVYKNSLY